MLKSTQVLLLAVTGVAVFVLSQPAVADYLDEVGYTTLKQRGVSLPTGAGLQVIQVEVKENNNYMPDTTSSQFTGKTITPKSGASGVSVHASLVGRYFYGKTGSMSGGILIIDVYEATHYRGTGSLHVGQPTVAPEDLSAFDVMNHSWIGSWPASDTEALRRFDWQIVNSGIVAVVGVDNVRYDSGWKGRQMPILWPTSYNSIAVGRTDGYSSNGPTMQDVAGRCKPDILAPMTATSWSAPLVSSASALLLAQADAMGWSSAHDPRTIKSILMAGAEKMCYERPRIDGVTIPSWQKGDSGTGDDEERPLDWYQGAGNLRVDRAWDILNAGSQAQDAAVSPLGWSLATVGLGDTVDTYTFQVVAQSQFTANLTWYRNVAGKNGGTFDTSVTLANLDLRLSRQSDGATIQLSASDIDNLEHIWLPILAPDTYVLEVIGDAGMSETYALAWQTMFHGDTNSDMDVDFADYQWLEANFGKTEAHWVDGDFNGDGKVSFTDYQMLEINFGAHMPEPATVALMTLGLAATYLFRRRRS